jgi:hypothetical protein
LGVDAALLLFLGPDLAEGALEAALGDEAVMNLMKSIRSHFKHLGFELHIAAQ